ncbi:hypothetical protein C7Y69_09410 [Alteromonas sp. KS69]|uniref:TnsA endonuclease N-terminal domain-containing protein n=1 Tax=Alteromonas sp. KS69 TaxID=2109917 RepID=UPI000F86842C|nr:TnsA endonuclease N-terminal domain-containing protein [Alteromonas sp. KS69]RUP81352.1 hypothetical protein C7Y69_09410 [Alteromonas sp. KS69]|tara:strand:+ start:25501 stop:26409 length:909 start_codon:yes stop_codon:yes gene_type:complete
MKRKPDTKPKLTQPVFTELTQKHIAEYKARVKFAGGYLPLRSARQFSSTGKATSEQLESSSQPHEYFSELERKFGLILGFMSNVSNVKTQFPLLNVKKTLEVAASLNLMHPRYEPKPNVADRNKGFQAAIMTTDFVFDLVDSSTGEVKTVACSLKYEKDLVPYDGNDRVVERTKDKLRIEKYYWEKLKGVEYQIISSAFWMFDKHLVKNLTCARVHRNLEIPPVLKVSILAHFIKALNYGKQRKLRLVDVIANLSMETSLPEGRLFAAFWYFVWTKKLQVNLFKPLADGGYVFEGEDFSWQL